MPELKSDFTPDDVKLLIESVGDWEVMNNRDYHVLEIVKSIPLPSEEEEAYEHISKLKDHFKKREDEILLKKEDRQEKAIFLKAKLMMVRKQMGLDGLFEMCSMGAGSASAAAIPNESVPVDASKVERLERKLALAEAFIKDIGITAHYDKFLADRAAEAAEKG